MAKATVGLDMLQLAQMNEMSFRQSEATRNLNGSMPNLNLKESALWLFRLHWRKIAIGLALLISSMQFAQAGYIFAKAKLAQLLIQQAWQHTLETGQTQAPWFWADTHPVAKLNMAGEKLYVLAGASGRNLAFGPAHLSQTPLPGLPGNTVIAGHRDTHFTVLQTLNIGEEFQLETQHGSTRYQVENIMVVHESQTELMGSSDITQLTLITCYPFNSALPNPEQRYVVQARPL